MAADVTLSLDRMSDTTLAASQQSGNSRQANSSVRHDTSILTELVETAGNRSNWHTATGHTGKSHWQMLATQTTSTKRRQSEMRCGVEGSEVKWRGV